MAARKRTNGVLFKDLRGFIEQSQELGELKVVNGANWDRELGGMTEMMAERKGPALLFDKIKGYPPGYRVLGNGFASLKNTGLVLGTPVDLKPMEMLDVWRKKVRQFKPVPPVEVKKGPVLENVLTGRDIDLYRFPAPIWHEGDGGRYLGTGTACITRDPDEGWLNIGAHRCMIVDKNHMTIGLARGHHAAIMVNKYHARGESAPIAICVGEDPVLYLSAGMMLTGWAESEYDWVGWARNEPVEVVRGKATGLPIPATAEIVIEAEIPPPSVMGRQLDGPFGEWLGHYSRTQAFPVVVKSILHRNDPIILGAPPFKPPTLWHFALPLEAAMVWNAMEASGIPGVTGVWNGLGAWGPPWLLVRINQQYAGHSKQAALAAVGSQPGCYGCKFVIVFDDDIDITNSEEVIWAMMDRVNVDNADIIHGVWTSPADIVSVTAESKAQGVATGSKMIIDACWPYLRKEEFVNLTKVSQPDRKKILSKWSKVFAD